MGKEVRMPNSKMECENIDGAIFGLFTVRIATVDILFGSGGPNSVLGQESQEIESIPG